MRDNDLFQMWEKDPRVLGLEVAHIKAKRVDSRKGGQKRKQRKNLERIEKRGGWVRERGWSGRASLRLKRKRGVWWEKKNSNEGELEEAREMNQEKKEKLREAKSYGVWAGKEPETRKQQKNLGSQGDEVVG